MMWSHYLVRFGWHLRLCDDHGIKQTYTHNITHRNTQRPKAAKRDREKEKRSRDDIDERK